VAWQFRRSLREAGLSTRWSTGLLVYTAIIAVTCIPADIDRMIQSTWTWVHACFVMGNAPVLFVVIPEIVTAYLAIAWLGWTLLPLR